jgi:predicted nucleotidyltransferase
MLEPRRDLRLESTRQARGFASSPKRYVENVEKATRSRIPHEQARALVDRILQRLDDPTPQLRHVERLAVFGSFAYGLADVDDVDLAIDYESNDMPDRRALERAAAALDEALAAVEAHERQLELDARQDARKLAADVKWLRNEVAKTVPPASAYLSRLRGRQVPPSSGPPPMDHEIKTLADELQCASDDWAAVLKKRVPFPQGTPVAVGTGYTKMIADIAGTSDRIHVYPGIDALDDWDFTDIVLLSERGDSIELARTRLAAIKVNAQATEKQKKPLSGSQWQPRR